MTMERQNIFDLIGKNTNKYSSCIICSYSFDFTFFEERILPALRTINVKNINLFVDGHNLDNLLSNESTVGFSNHHSYSINPIFINGAFHPKIMFLTGQKFGLLLIGSGNLTASGMSSNDEIWGAFHLTPDNENLSPIFAEAWAFLETLFPYAIGFNKEMIGWISQRSTWVKDLAKYRNNNFIKIGNEKEIAFVSNSSQTNVFTRLTELIPKEGITELNIISPYFDSSAEALDNLIIYYNPTLCNVITDFEFGLLPYNIPDALTNRVCFYDWNCFAINNNNQYNRLHAKIYQFKYSDGKEYLVFGSANCSINALGSLKVKPSNYEVVLVIKRISKTGYLADWEITFDNIDPKPIPKVTTSDALIRESAYVTNNLIRILHAELSFNSLNIHINKTFNEECNLVFIDQYSNIVHSLKITPNEYEINLQISEDLINTRLFLEYKSCKKSNISIIHNIDVLNKCNPDPQFFELNSIISELEGDPDGDKYIELLKHTDYSWVEAEIDNPVKLHKKVSYSSISAEDIKEFDDISTDEFNALPSLQQQAKFILSDKNVLISDVLNIIAKRLPKLDDDISESQEEAILSEFEEERSGKGEAVSDKLNFKYRGQEVQTKIFKHLIEVDKFYQKSLTKIKNSGEIKDLPNRQLTIKDCSHLSIALSLLYIFQNKTFITKFTRIFIRHTKLKLNQIKNIEDSFKLQIVLDLEANGKGLTSYYVSTDVFPFLLEHLDSIDKNLFLVQDEYLIKENTLRFIIDNDPTGKNRVTIKSWLIKSLGAFIINASSNFGFKDYPYKSVQDKLINLRMSIFFNASFLICNLFWSEDDLIYFDILLLNLLHFIRHNGTGLDIDSINDHILSLRNNANFVNNHFANNLDRYIKNILPSYQEWSINWSDNKDHGGTNLCNLSRFNIIFISNLGFCGFYKNLFQKIQIVHPAFDYNDIGRCNLLELNYYVSKIIALK